MVAKSLNTEKKAAAGEAGPVAIGLKGYTGTTIWAGYVHEEKLDNLRGRRGSEQYDEMRRGCAQTKKILTGIKNPIKAAKWAFEPSGETDAHKKAAQFCKWNWTDNPYFKFRKYVNEKLTAVEFGFVAHERTYGVYQHREFGLVHCINNLAFRHQTTIERWIVKGREGLTGVEQYAVGDTVDGSSSAIVTIPRENLLIFTPDQEGDNYEGISHLRAAYGAWFRKQHLLKMMMIGAEKSAVSTPIGIYPGGLQDAERDAFQAILGNYTVNESNYLMFAKGFEVTTIKNDFDAEKLMAAIVYEDGQIAGSVLMSFLELGQNGNGGSFALGADQSDFALSSLQCLGDMIAEEISCENEYLCQINFGDPDLKPIVKCLGINDKAGKELADLIKVYVDGRIIRPDDTLEAHVRKTHDLPEAETLRADDPPPPVVTPPGVVPAKEGDDPEVEPPEVVPPPKDKELSDLAREWTPFRALSAYEEPMRVNLSAMFKENLKARDKLHQAMKSNLYATADFLVRKLEEGVKTAQGNGKAPDLIKIAGNVAAKLNTSRYQATLEREMTRLVSIGIEQAERDLGAKANGVKLADKSKPGLEFLPAHVQKALKKQAETQAQANAQKLKDILTHGVTNGTADEQTPEQIVSDIEDRLGEYIESPQVGGAAGTITSQAINRGRDGFFWNADNLKQIQAFQYSAILDDATSDICLSLDGKIFKPNDPDANRFAPPNHHGCRSILVPITINEDEPELTGIGPDPSNRALLDEYTRRGTTPPDMAKIKKSRNLSETWRFYAV